MAYKILSIDGGGIRGILPGEILSKLEEKLQKKTGDQDARLCDFFDLFSGTSTGAILSSSYVSPDPKQPDRPLYSAREAVNFYLNKGNKIFSLNLLQRAKSINNLNDEKYSSNELERALKYSFKDIKMSDLLKPTCLVSYDIQERMPKIYNSRHTKKDGDFLVRDILRGSTAAPTFFEPACIYSIDKPIRKQILVDGGLVANDPTLCAYSEAIKSGIGGIKDMYILSIGTGKKLKSYEYNNIKDYGLISWAKPLIDISIEGGPQMTEYHMQKIASTVNKEVYHRIQPDLFNASPDLDDASYKNLHELKIAGKKNAQLLDEELERISDFLIYN